MANEGYISFCYRRNIKRAYNNLGIKYNLISPPIPFFIHSPPNFEFVATFPDGEVSKIHLTEERGYEDIDGTAHLRFYKDFVTRIFSRISRLNCKKIILDCACGSGYGSNFIASTCQVPVLGVDIDDNVIKYARKRYALLSNYLSFLTANAMDLNTIQTASLGSIISVETIEHIPKPEKALSEFSRILDPNGVLFITSPDATMHPNSLLSRFHVREYTPDLFQELLEQYFHSVYLSTDGHHIVGICRK